MIHAFVTQYPLIAFVFLGLLSLSVGSLLNVIIYRLPIMMNDEWTTQCQQRLQLPETPKKKINLWFPRSFCPSCHHPIPFWHNLPLISYALLRGQCRTCQHPISVRYPLVELSYFILSIVAALHFGFGPALLFSLLFIGYVTCLGIIDLQHQWLPDNLTLGLLWLGLIANTKELFTTLPNAVLSAAGAYLLLWLLMKLFFLITGKIGMGHGDFKLFAAFGAWFGVVELPRILLISSLSGVLVGGIYLKITAQSKETPIPFGPFLCFAGLVSLFYTH